MLAARAALEGRRHTAMRFSCGPTLSVVDELGCLPPPAEVAAGLFEVVQRRYRGIRSPGQIFDNPMIAAALLDRLLHRSVVIQIDSSSHRIRTHRARGENPHRALRP